MKFFILSIVVLSSFNTFAAGLYHPTLANPISEWKSITNRSFLLCKIKNKKRKEKSITKTIKVFFDTDIDQLDNKAKKKIMSAIKTHYIPGKVIIKLDAHADILGNSDYNQDLSKRRLLSSRHFLIENGVIKKDINELKFYGEVESSAHQRKDRYVEISFTKIIPVIENIKQVYLVDGSKSMISRLTKTGYSFDDLRRMEIPKHTIVYVVRDPRVGCSGEKISNYIPDGYTHIKEAMGLIADFAKGPLKVFAFTDSEEQITYEANRIIDNAINFSKKRNVKWKVL